MLIVGGCRTTASIEKQNIAQRQRLLKECNYILFNDNSRLAKEMWRCQHSNKTERFLTTTEQEVLKLRDYRYDRDDVAYSQQTASKALGAMAPEEIEWVIRKNSFDLGACQKNSGHNAQLKIYLNIEQSGKVSEAKLLDSAHVSNSSQKCLVKEIKNWKFPELRAGLKNLEVNYPVKFEN